MPREYFSHDYNAREDDKIMHLISELGYEGYGIYWALVEMLYKSGGSVQLNYKSISFVLHVNYKILERLINEFDLFKIHDERLYSDSILERLKIRKDISDKRSKAVKIRYLHNSTTNVEQKNNKTRENRKRNIYKESIINNTKESFDPLEIEKKIAENEFELMNSHSWIEQTGMQYGLDAQQTADRLSEWISEMKLKEMMARPLKELKSHFINTMRLYHQQQKKRNGKQTFAEYASEILRGPH